MMQQYADIYLLLNYCTCFGRPSPQSSGEHKTVVASSSTDHIIWRAIFFKRDQIRTYLVTFEEDWSPDGIVAASSTEHIILESSFFKRDQIIHYLDTCFFKRDQIRTTWSRLKKLAPQIVRSVPEAATTVLCTPDDGRDGRTIHVE